MPTQSRRNHTRRQYPTEAMFRTRDGSAFHLALDPDEPGRITDLRWRGIRVDLGEFLEQLDDAEARSLAWLVLGDLYGELR